MSKYNVNAKNNAVRIFSLLAVCVVALFLFYAYAVPVLSILGDASVLILESPANNSYIKGTYILNATIQGGNVTNVSFFYLNSSGYGYIDINETAGIDDGSGNLNNLTLSFDTSILKDGVYEFFANATNLTGEIVLNDTNGNIIVDNTPPQVIDQESLPMEGEYGSRTVTFNCSAYDNINLDAIRITVWFGDGSFFIEWDTQRTGNLNYTNITYTFDKTIIKQAHNSFIWGCRVNDTAGNYNYMTNRSILIAVSDLYGTVKNSTGSLVDGVNVSLYKFIQQQNGPPIEEYVKSNLTVGGSFVIYDVNVSRQQGQQPMFKVYVTLNNSRGNVTEVGPVLPPFPAEMIFKESPGAQLPPDISGLNGSTIYLQPAGTINITVLNATDDTINFGYEIIDQKLGFPIKSCIKCNVTNVRVVVPRDRNYTVMIMRDPEIFNESQECWSVDGPKIFQTFCPSPPVSNNSIYGSMFEESNDYVMNVQVNGSYSQRYLYGYINVSGNATAVNATRIVPKLIPWPGFVPPMKAEIESFNITRNFNFTKGEEAGYIAFYNISVMASPLGIEYLVEFYGNGTNEYFASFRNVTIKEDKELNVTLTKLAGNYTVGGDVNTSKVTVQLQNSTGGALTTNAHVEVEVKHNSLYGGQPVHYIIEQLTDGSFSMPFLNDSTVRVKIFSQDSAPRAIKLNLSKNWTNITLKSFDMEFVNETGDFDFNETEKQEFIDIRFYRNSNECNVPNPPDSCQLGNSFSGAFDPFQALMAGKSNLKIRLKTTNITLYFINVDLLASGPPDAELSQDAISDASTSTSLEKAWRFGSLAPNIYDYVWVGIPYSGLNESWGYSVKIPYLYDENWNMIWNVSEDGPNPGSVYHEYEDYPTSWFSGQGCSKTDSTANCFMNTTTNYIWLKIPHFSGVQPTLTGSAPVATTTTGGSASSSGGSSASTLIIGEMLKKRFTSITPITPRTIGEIELRNTNTGLKEIYISVKNLVVGVVLTISKLDKRPESVAQMAGKVYKYINITKTNLDDSDIETGKIKFTVSKAWISENGFNSSLISLYRYAGKWEKLPTKKLSESDAEVEYEATTPGFSIFAVAGEMPATEEKQAGEKQQQPPKQEEQHKKENVEQQKTAKEQPKTDYRWLFVLLTIGIIAGAAYYFAKEKKRIK